MNGKLFFFIAGLSALCWEGNVAAGQIYQFTTIAGLAGASGNVDGTNNEARFNGPTSLAIDKGGNIYVTDCQFTVIRKVTPVGTNWVVSTIAGSAELSGSADGTNSEARFGTDHDAVLGIAVDEQGCLYVADTGNHTIRKVAPVGTNWVVSTIAGSAGLYGSADGTNSEARFNMPAALEVDGDGNLYVADCANCIIRKVAPVGTNWVVSTIAGSAGRPGRTDGSTSDPWFSPRFCYPFGIALDSQGNLYVSDDGNYNIRKMAPVGTNWVVSTLAGMAGFPGSADGTGSNAQFHDPMGIEVGNSGVLYVADIGNHTIRQLMPEGMDWIVSTIGGTPGTRGSDDGVTGVAQFNMVADVAVDALGTLYIADYGNHTIRMGAPLTVRIVQVDSRTIQGTWRTLPGRTYEVQYTSDLRTASWSPLGNRIAAGGTALSFSDTVGGEAQRFYRIVLIP